MSVSKQTHYAQSRITHHDKIMHHRHRKNWQNHNWKKEEWPKEWQPSARLFIWFMFMFGLMIMLLLGGAGLLIYTVVRTVEETAVPPRLIFSIFFLIFFIPVLILRIGRRTFSGVATVAEVMRAADQVAAGDLTVRVSEKRRRRNRFARLAISFNNMASELQKNDERRRNLTADIAHELRTPLHIIQGNLEGILDGVYEPTPEHLNATIEETHTLARLVDDLHTIAQAEAGQLSLHLAQVDVSELLADVQTSFSGQAEDKGIHLDVKFTGKPIDLTVEADAGRIDQVISNLVVNALRHTPAGGTIELETYPEADDVFIEVSDTGEGISKEDLPFIFDRFWRGDRARSHLAGEGGGLGLAIVKQLVEAHNGRISVSSQPNQGTTFTIILPKPS